MFFAEAMKSRKPALRSLRITELSTALRFSAAYRCRCRRSEGMDDGLVGITFSRAIYRIEYPKLHGYWRWVTVCSMPPPHVTMIAALSRLNVNFFRPSKLSRFMHSQRTSGKLNNMADDGSLETPRIYRRSWWVEYLSIISLF